MKQTSNSVRSASLLILLLLFTVLATAAPRSGKYLVYVGTYTGEGTKSKGIYAFRYDAATGQLTPLGLAAETTTRSFGAAHQTGMFLYAGDEGGHRTA